MKKLAFAACKSAARRNFGLFTAIVMLAMVTVDSNVQAALPPATTNGIAANAPVSDAAVRQYVSDAQKALKSGNLRLAVILLKNAVTAAPRNGQVRAQLGVVLLQSGDPASAESQLRQARGDGAIDKFVLPALFQAMLARHKDQALLDEFPDPVPSAQGAGIADLLKARAIALQNLGHPSDAAAAMDRSLKLRKDIPGLLARARLAQQQNNLSLAKTISDEALNLSPTSSDALMFKLGLLMLSNDAKGALALSDQLVQLYPNNLAPRLARVEIFLKLKQDAKARVDVDAILSKAPNAAIGLYYKAVLLARANNIKGAWQIAQSLPPEFVQSQPTIAILVSQMAIGSGNIETGASILTGTLAKFPDLLEIRLRLAALRMRQNSPEAALSVLLPVKDSVDPRVLGLLSQLYLKLGKYSEALDVLNKLNISGSTNSSVQRELALVEMRSGQSDQGIKDLQDLAAKQPTDPTIIAPLVAALVQAKRFPEALAAAGRLGADPKQRVLSYFYRGQILVLQNDINGALTAFQNALQLDPKNVASLYYRASLYQALKKYPEAGRDLQAILTIDPKNVTALVKSAEIAAQQNQDQVVRALLSKATSVAPKDPTPRIALILHLVARQDLKGALSTAAELLRVLPNNPNGLAMLGEIQLALGQKSDAVATFRTLAGILPKSAKPQLLLAKALFANGDRIGASVALAAAGSLEPHSGEVRAQQINLLFEQGDVNGAVTSAKVFQSANPGTSSDLLLADTLVRANKPDQAAEVLLHSSDVKPDARVLLRMVQLEDKTGDRKKAEDQLAKWLKANEHDIAVRTQYATFLLQDGDKTNAVAQFEVVLRQDPNNIVALNNLGWLLQKDDPTRALSLLSLAYKLAPDLPDVVDSLGWIKLQMKDSKGAVELLKRAHSLRTKDGEIAYHLVLALDASGDRNAAKSLLEVLLSSGVKFEDLAKAQQLATTWH